MGAGASERWRAVRRAVGADPVRVGRVLQTYDRSAYLELDPDLTEAVSTPGPSLVLVGDQSFSGPLAMQLRPAAPGGFSAERLTADADCQLRSSGGETVVSIGAAIEVVFDDAVLATGDGTVDRVTPITEIDRGDPVWEANRAILAWAIDDGLEDGLGWLEALAAIVAGEAADHDLRSVAAAWRTVLAGDGPPEPAGAAAILGRGPGATPSGDDVLSGLLLASWATTAGRRPRVRRAGTALVDRALEATTTVSAALLAQAAVGRAGDAVAAALEALLAASVPMERRRAAVTRVTSLGHTSGTDMLVGLLAMVLLVAPAIEA